MSPRRWDIVRSHAWVRSETVPVPTPELDRVLDRPMPTLPGVAAAVVLQLGKTPPATDEASQWAALDPGWTVRLLSVGRGRGRLDVPSAARMAGERALAGLAARMELVDSEDEARVIAQGWRRGAVAGEAAEAFARAAGIDASGLLAAGVLQDAGELAMLRAHGRRWAIVRSQAGHDHGALARHERDAFGVSHAEAGAEWIRRLGVAEEIVTLVRAHHQEASPPSEIVGQVRAIAIGRLLNEAVSGPDAQDARKRLLERTGLWFGRSGPGLAESVLDGVRTRARRLDETLGRWPQEHADVVRGRILALGGDGAPDSASARAA